MKSNRRLNDYVVVYDPENPQAMKSKNWKGYVYEHIKVAEEFMGRPLKDGEIVHHLDGVRSNNFPRNLLVIDESQHTKLHAWINAGAPFKGNNLLGKVVSAGWEPSKPCPVCGHSVLNTQAKYCSTKCVQVALRGNRRPDKETLTRSLMSCKSMLALGRQYGVSDSAVRKWCKYYDIDYKSLLNKDRTRQK